LRARAGIVDRAARGRLLLTGADRRSYLQGLLTNDIAALTPGTGCYAAYLTPQGRMISDMRVFELGDAILLDLEGGAAATVRDRFSQFIFADDVEVRDLTGSTTQVGLYGPEASPVLSAALRAVAGSDEPAPSTDQLEGMAVQANARWSHAGAPVYLLRSDDVGVAGFDLVVDPSHRTGVVAALRAAGAEDVDEQTAETTRIEAGRPRFGVDMTEDTIPLEAGIEDRAISRTKGCYVGQEIIIRVLDRGHGRVARRLVGLQFSSSDAPSRGGIIRAADRDIGHITSSTFSPLLDTAIALGYVHRDFADPGTAVAAVERQAIVVSTPFSRAGA
jgi:folate-binding protein YgfZ